MDEERDDTMPDKKPVAPDTGLLVDLNADGLYEIILEKDRAIAVQCGVDPPFPPERWDIMVNRAAAFGLTLVKKEI